MNDLTQLRRDCENRGLFEHDLAADPFAQFEVWYQEAADNAPATWYEVNAMSLSTSTKDGDVSSRTVLLKHHDESGFVFFTSYDSKKGQALDENPRAALLFHWAYLARQIRIEGRVERTSRQLSEKYFHSRPRGAQISACVSVQSSVVATRKELERKASALEAELRGAVVPLPDHWGGYRLIPVAVEFWQGRRNRMHDRMRYRVEGGNWVTERLGP